MKRFIIALVILLVTVTLCVCGDIAFSSQMKKAEAAFSEALETVQADESPDFVTAKIVRLSKKLDRIYFTAASRVNLETLTVNSGVLTHCLQNGDIEMYTLVCSESLQLIREMLSGQRVSVWNIF